MTTDEILKFEIARELIIKAGGEGNDEQVQEILDACKGHPWDCGVLYKVREAAKATQ